MIEVVGSLPLVVAEADSDGQDLGVWLIESDPQSPESWETLLANATPVRSRPLVLRGRLAPDAGSLTALRRGPGEVLLVVGPIPAGADWLAAVRDCGKGLVIPVAPSLALKGCDVPVVFMPPNPSADMLALALFSADAAARREGRLREECLQLQQRLQDRILLERAKDVLRRRLNVSEEEAYRRLRATARRQRRTLRDVARAILDTETLLDEPAAGPSTVEEANR